MTDNRRVDDLSAEEHFALAAKKMSEEGNDTMTDMELRLEEASRRLVGSELLRQLEKPESPKAKRCPSCGKRVRVRAHDKSRTLRTLGGEVTYRRNYHYCDGCRRGFYPRDLELRIPEDGELSSEVERRVVDFGINDPDARAAERFSMHYSTTISANQVRKALARTGERMECSSLEWLEESLLQPDTSETGALIVQADGGMVSTLVGWKEVKLAVVHNHPQAPQTSTKSRKTKAPRARYVGRLGSQQEFEDALEQAMNAHSKDRPKQIVWLGDGAPGYWAICKRLAPDAVEILDWYHAMEHAAECSKALFASGSMVRLYVERIEHLLWNGEIDLLLEELEASKFLCDSQAQLGAIDDLMRYYRSNAHRMNYPLYRQHGWPIGSGRVESAHKHVIQQRMKRAGQHWSLNRARTTVRLRTAYSTAGPRDFYRAIDRALEKSLAA